MDTLTSHPTTRKQPTPYQYYGLKLYIRCEQKDGYWTYIAVSYRVTGSGVQRNRNKIIRGWRYVPISDQPLPSTTPIPEEVIDRTLHTVLPRYVIPQLFDSGIVIKSSDMPFGLLGPYAYGRLTKYDRVSPKYQATRQAAMDRMITLWGDRPLCDISPEYCGPDLVDMQPSHVKDCVRLLRKLYEADLGILVTDPQIWHRYDLSAYDRPYDPRRIARNQLINLPWSPAYREQAIQRCLDGIDHPKYGGQYLLALAMMTVPITINEGCALQLGSLTPIPGYPDHYQLAISHTIHVQNRTAGRRQRGPKHTRIPITDPHRKRLVAVSNLLATAWLRYRALHPTEDDSTLLVVSAKNNKRVMPIKGYSEWLDDEFAQYGFASINTGDQTIKATYDAARHMTDTAIETLQQARYTSAELRHQQGLSPQTMAARHYAGYDAPAVQVKMCAMQDAYQMQHVGYNPQSSNRRQSVAAGQAYKTTYVHYTVTFAPNTASQNIILRLSTVYGANITVQSTTQEDITNETHQD